MIDTFSNTNLEIELATSNILKVVPIPPDYTYLRVIISELPILDTSDLSPLTYPKNLVDSKGLLKASAIESYYLGKNESLLSEFENLLMEVTKLIPEYQIIVKKFYEYIESTLDNSDLGYFFDEFASTVNSVQGTADEMQRYDDLQIDLRKLEGLLNFTISQYGVGVSKIPSKGYFKTYNTEYKLYLNTLLTDYENVVTSPEVMMVLGKVIDSISTLDKPEDTSTFTKEQRENLLELLMNPEDFYKRCKLQEIISPLVGTLFGHCYPGFYHMFLDMYLDDYEKMNYQEQINFRKCFGLDENNSQLVTLCSNYINRDFNPQGATI